MSQQNSKSTATPAYLGAIDVAIEVSNTKPFGLKTPQEQKNFNDGSPWKIIYNHLKTLKYGNDKAMQWDKLRLLWTMVSVHHIPAYMSYAFILLVCRSERRVV